MEPIRLTPVFMQKIWGGNRLRDKFNYDIPFDHCGECRVSDADSPILVKLIDAREDLSVQVHPDDAYAHAHENGASGKAECWYILDAKPGSSIVLGHNAKNREQLQDMIFEGRWDSLLRVVPVHPGDLFMIPPGTLHAIRAGVMLLEVQQNSDLTYRFYDYDRLENGKPRELHIEKALDVVTAPFRPADANPVLRPTSNPAFVQLCTCEHFTVWKLEVRTSSLLVQDRDFMIISAVDGAGQINESPAKAGDHFLLPRDFGSARVTGDLTLIIASP